ncbi:MAG: DUF2652 domain-containing protein [Anaerolineales bacterium]
MLTSQDGFLLIADITGYTAFLRESELDHAKDSLRSLLDLLIEHTKPPLVISRLEGDAVISYAPDGSFQQGQTLVELIEGTYVEFRRALDLMVLNTTCNCLACRNIANLDLKFFVHYGRFALEPLPSYTELIGTDVNIIHRLTKNTVTNETGFSAYVLYTQAALDHLGIPDMAAQLTPHVESYEQIGEVNAYLLDMHPIWEIRRHRFHTVVKPGDSVYTFEKDFRLSPAPLWEYLTNPEYRTIIFGADSQRLEDLKQGRIGDGSVYVCAHGKNITLQSIVDWHPFEQYTVKSSSPGGGDNLVTIRLTPQENGTTVTVLSGKTQGGAAIMRGPVNIVIRRIIGPSMQKNLQAFGELIENEIAEGKVAQLPSVQINADQIEFALTESLAEA